jgi:Kef-type K+ transport system membrane component KefB
VAQNQASDALRARPILQVALLTILALVLGVSAGQNGSPDRGMLLAGVLLTVGGTLIAIDHRRRRGQSRDWDEWVLRQSLVLRCIVGAAVMALIFAMVAGFYSGSWGKATFMFLVGFAAWGALFGWANRPSRTR